MTRGVVLRGIGFALAIALGAVAVWLIVTSTTQKRIETRRPGRFVGAAARRVRRCSAPAGQHSAGASGYDVPAAAPAQPIELRSAGAELERARGRRGRGGRDSSASRDMLRREIQVTLGREVSALRSEIAELRSELVEKVGGQLRLERIETTRRHRLGPRGPAAEVRQLKFAADTGESRSGPAARARPSPRRRARSSSRARVRPVSRQTADIEADVQRRSHPRYPSTCPPAPAADPLPP